MGKVKIHKFKNLSNYQICGGIIHLKWEVSNAFCTILTSTKFLQFFTKTTEIKLLTNNPRKVVGLKGYGITISDRIPIQMNHNERNKHYLKTKKEKLGHILKGEF